MVMATIVITGGHHNSALVVAQELVKRGVKVIWFGHRHSSRGDTHDSAEYLAVKASDLPFYDLHAGKLNSTPTLSEITNIPLGFVHAAKLLKQVRPTAVLSFGGYLGLTTALPAALLRIPVYLHEQTVISGRANRLTALLARHIFLTWDSSQRFFPRHKSSVVGLPLRPSLLSVPATKLFPNKLPTILVMGGKQGSHLINTQVFAALPDILSHYNLVHQTGTNSATGDLARALELKQTLPPVLRSRYQPLGYISDRDLGVYFASVDLYLGRSGAHITYELVLLGLRSLLIPFMHTPGSEQYQQALYLQAAGNAIILPETSLSATTLVAEISRALALPHPHPLDLPLHATETLCDQLLSQL